MLLDTLMTILDSVDHAGTLNGEADLGDAKAAQKGNLRFRLQGVEDASGAAVASTGITLTLTSRSTSGSGGTAIMTLVMTAAQVNAGVEFTIPSFCARYAYMALTGTITAGAFTLAQVETGDLNSLTIA
jgi:hypothetical protein